MITVITGHQVKQHHPKSDLDDHVPNESTCYVPQSGNNRAGILHQPDSCKNLAVFSISFRIVCRVNFLQESGTVPNIIS